MKLYSYEATVLQFEHFAARKLINATLLVENARKHYYVTTELRKRLYLFDIVLLLVEYVYSHIKTSIFLSIFCCFFTGFTGLSKKC